MDIRGLCAPLLAATLAGCTLAGGAHARDAFTPGIHGFLDSDGTFTQIDVPGARETEAFGVNNVGQIVGRFVKGLQQHGFLDSGGIFTQINVPFASESIASGINDSGQIVGITTSSPGAQGFLDSGGIFTQINFPGAYYTEPFGINNAGQIVGFFGYSTGGPHGFLDSGGTFTQIDYPGYYTYPEGINDAGQIVGFIWSPPDFGFLDSGGTFTRFRVPGATTDAVGINDAGQIVGWFNNLLTGGEFGPRHGFLYTGGAFTQIDVPGASSTQAYGINGAGQIVGSTMVVGGTGDPHFTTYDGVHYNFQGIGDFLLARSTVGGDQFDVQIRTEAGNNGSSHIEGAAATLCGHRVVFDAAPAGSGFARLNGAAISLSVGGSASIAGACKIVEVSPKQYEVLWDTGETLDVTDNGASLTVSTQLSSIDGSGSVDGLLASNSNPDSWRVTDANSLFDTPEPATFVLLGAGLPGLAVARRRQVSEMIAASARRSA